MADTWEAAARALGRALGGEQRDRLARYVDRLVDANRAVNLTAVRDPAAIWSRHLLESLTLAQFLEARGAPPGNGSLIDVGSGGGLPGIPIAIVRPDLHVVLLDATHKKTEFLAAASADLGLDNVRVVTARAEEAGRDPHHREQYDTVVARAVAPLDVLAELTVPLARVGGLVAAVKGSRAADEVAAARIAVERCGGEIGAIAPLSLATTDPLSVVVIWKRAATPAEYPRRPGIPAKRPLRG